MRSNFHNNKKTQTINQILQNKRPYFQSQTKTTRQTSTTQTMEQETPKSNAEKNTRPTSTTQTMKQKANSTKCSNITKTTTQKAER